MQTKSHIFVLSLILPLVHAQFGTFFDQMFGGHHQQPQQQQRPSGTSQWAAHSDSMQCSQYLCTDTLACVSQPSECPCPSVEDVKCMVPDTQDKDAATVVCVRGETECSVVERLMRSYSK
ncbi:hypothetical protein SERLA73DRAFT_49250 [Serpula lacrymans var. lacrymans S7.3]|uniref:Long chronological lifespan protein 2 n=2 Tax=Serpula lacrymans var. lacrymans TaxID=341189 RepID=F8PPM3_SERL3|nr:uncharacterized protein SERLADRAFT_346933 [Serpula lacrymans var. lacrymans S7.9]EGO02081.1 hypothetical protein SERLA73DRAFT_49250 [Serpula lacrymans var. lacrymans S7.3]EGO27707.1 hypothetical protein SERLADRAFT_346933 [Serpula lacrymans var. lacrymans S7.9]